MVLAEAGNGDGYRHHFRSLRARRDRAEQSGSPNALQGFSQNRDEPVKIRAASLEIREKDKMATLTGDVYVLQGDTEMHCKMLVVSYEAETGTRAADAATAGPGGDRQIRLIEAKGDVVVVQRVKMRPGTPPPSTCVRTR
jgi:lipopolysaccharide export system protein LptA